MQSLLSTPSVTARVPRHPHTPMPSLDTKDTNSNAPTACICRASAPRATAPHTRRGISAQPRKRPIGRDEVATAAREGPDHRLDCLRGSDTCAGRWGRCGIFLEGHGCAVAGSAWAAHGQRGGQAGAHLRLRHRSCRSQRSTEPGCEAGSHQRREQCRNALEFVAAAPDAPPAPKVVRAVDDNCVT